MCKNKRSEVGEDSSNPESRVNDNCVRTNTAVDNCVWSKNTKTFDKSRRGPYTYVDTLPDGGHFTMSLFSMVVTPQTVTQKTPRIYIHTHSHSHSHTHKRIHTKLVEDGDMEYIRPVGVSDRDGQVIAIGDGEVSLGESWESRRIGQSFESPRRCQELCEVSQPRDSVESSPSQSIQPF